MARRCPCRIWAVPESEKALGRKEGGHCLLPALCQQTGRSVIMEAVVRPDNVGVVASRCRFIHSRGRISPFLDLFV